MTINKLIPNAKIIKAKVVKIVASQKEKPLETTHNIEEQKVDKQEIEKGVIPFVVMPLTFDPASFLEKLLLGFRKITKPINIDVNSFLEAVPNHKESIVNSFFVADAIVNDCYSLKSKKTKIVNNFQIDLKKYDDLVKRATVLAAQEKFANDHINTPANILGTSEFAADIVDLFKKNKIETSVISYPELKKQGFGLILGVGAGSTKNKPAVVIGKYCSDPKKPLVAVIGKGLVYDTGGLSLKPSAFMAHMHTDMTGAASVAGLIVALAQQKIAANVVVFCPLASNDIGPDSLRVSDVITSYSKKTVEITNTDAEGRLVMADCISYAKEKYKPSVIITVATLTGSIIAAVGHAYTGVFSSKEAL